MVTFIYQFDWVMRCPFVGQTFLKSLWELFWMQLAFKSIEWVKQITLSYVGGPHPISWRPEYNKRANPPTNKREFLLPDGLWTGTSAFSLWLQMLTETSVLPGSPECQPSNWNYIAGYPDSQFFRLAPELNHQSSWVTRLPSRSAALETSQPP